MPHYEITFQSPVVDAILLAVDEAGTQPEPTPELSEAELDARRNERLLAAVEMLQKQLHELNQQLHRQVDHLRESALESARQMLFLILQQDESLAAERAIIQIQLGLQQMQSVPVTVSVHPDIQAAIKDAISEQEMVNIQLNPGLPVGDAILETDRHSIATHLDRQLRTAVQYLRENVEVDHG